MDRLIFLNEHEHFPQGVGLSGNTMVDVICDMYKWDLLTMYERNKYLYHIHYQVITGDWSLNMQGFVMPSDDKRNPVYTTFHNGLIECMFRSSYWPQYYIAGMGYAYDVGANFIKVEDEAEIDIDNME